jgi:hypothetical protein
MRNALPGVVHVDEVDARFLSSRPRLGDESLPPWHQSLVAAARTGIDDMIHDAEDPSRIHDLPPRRTKRVERNRPRPLVQEDPVDRDQARSARKVGNDMRLPQFLEKAAWPGQRALSN